MLEISNINYDIFKIPDFFGRHVALDNLKTKLTDAIQQDISFIVKDGPPKSLTDTEKPLKKLFDRVKTLPESKQKEDIFQQFRFLNLVLNNRLIAYSNSDAGILSKTLDDIKEVVGVVPVLNPVVKLPDKEFLPKNYFTQTMEKWSKIYWKDPGRYMKKEKLSFFEYKEGHTTSVRAHLLALEKTSEHPDFFLSYADADFYHYGNLQADHLQPSEQIVARQKELIFSMNIDPIFKKKTFESPYNNSYFILVDKEETVVGSKKFYMEYHNCLENLWMITTAENTGQGKGNADPITWLNSHPNFGKEFFDSLGDKKVQTDTILYREPDGMILAEYAKKWFKDHYRNEIAATSFIDFQIKTPMKTQTATLSDLRKKGGSWKRKSIKQQAELGIASLLGQGSSSAFFTADDSDSSIHSSDIESAEAEITKSTLRRSKRLAKEEQDGLDGITSNVSGKIFKDILSKSQ